MYVENRMTLGFLPKDMEPGTRISAFNYPNSVTIGIEDGGGLVRDCRTDEVLYMGAFTDDFWDADSPMWEEIYRHVAEVTGERISKGMLKQLWSLGSVRVRDPRILEIHAEDGEFEMLRKYRGKWFAYCEAVEINDEDEDMARICPGACEQVCLDRMFIARSR